MKKMVMISYNEAIDAEVMETLTHCGTRNYTKVLGVFGKGTTSGTHMGDDIWPGRNNILYVACAEAEAASLLGCLKGLRVTLGHEGLKAFVWTLDEVTD